MADLDLLREFQIYLVAQGIGVLPFAPAPAVGVTTVSIWKYPRDGAALPRNVSKVAGVVTGESMIALVDTMMQPPSRYEPWLEETFVDVIVRSPQAATGKLLQRRIRDLVEPYTTLGGRKNWMMGDLRVEYSRQWRGDQPLPQRQATSESDPHQTYDRVASYMFGCRRKVLAGLSIP